MKLCIISDTHNKHKQLILPNADVIIHCGDMTSAGKENEVNDFFKWFSNLNQYKYKICIAGNHDWLFDRNRILALSHKPDNVIYLQDNEIIINNIKFYGTPVQKLFHNWAFNRSEEKLAQHWAAIPDDVDVLITHSPPQMVLDWVNRSSSHEGSPTLYKEVVQRIKPQIHCFGHIHDGYGKNEMNGIIFINASNLNEDYNCVNEPIVVEI